MKFTIKQEISWAGMCLHTYSAHCKREEYYRFLGSLEMQPYVQDRTDEAILHGDTTKRSQRFEMEERYGPLARRLAKQVPRAKANEIKRRVLELLKRNANSSMDDLNKKVMALFRADEGFNQPYGACDWQIGRHRFAASVAAPPSVRTRSQLFTKGHGADGLRVGAGNGARAAQNWRRHRRHSA
jgi:hypothetical protein